MSQARYRLKKDRRLYGLEGRDLNRMKVRIRDDFTCQDCGLRRTAFAVKTFNKKMPTLKGKMKNLDIHHINGLCGKKSKAYDSVLDMPNLVTLCHKCHYNRPEHRVKSAEYALLMSANAKGGVYSIKTLISRRGHEWTKLNHREAYEKLMKTA